MTQLIVSVCGKSRRWTAQGLGQQQGSTVETDRERRRESEGGGTKWVGIEQGITWALECTCFVMQSLPALSGGSAMEYSMRKRTRRNVRFIWSNVQSWPLHGTVDPPSSHSPLYNRGTLLTPA